MKIIVENTAAYETSYRIIDAISKLKGVINVGSSDLDSLNRVDIQIDLRGAYETFSPMGRKYYGEFTQDVRKLKSEVVKILNKNNATIVSWDSPIKKYWKSAVDGKREGGYDSNTVYAEIAIKIHEMANSNKFSNINEVMVTNIPNFNLESDVYIALVSLLKSKSGFNSASIKYGKILYDRISAGHSPTDTAKFVFPLLSGEYRKLIAPSVIMDVVAIVNKRAVRLGIGSAQSRDKDISRRFAGILTMGVIDSLINSPLDWDLVKGLGDAQLLDLANAHSVRRGGIKLAGMLKKSNVSETKLAGMVIREGKFSEIDMMANDAGSFEQFVKEFYIEYKEFPKDKETLKWLKSIYQNRSGK